MRMAIMAPWITVFLEPLLNKIKCPQVKDPNSKKYKGTIRIPSNPKERTDKQIDKWTHRWTKSLLELARFYSAAKNQGFQKSIKVIGLQCIYIKKLCKIFICIAGHLSTWVQGEQLPPPPTFGDFWPKLLTYVLNFQFLPSPHLILEGLLSPHY